MRSNRPRVLVASSSEALPIARGFQAELGEDADVQLWPQNLVDSGQSVLEGLLQKTHSFDFAIVVLSPDDSVTSRNQSDPASRDNVIFELGMFMGILGRERTFPVRPNGSNSRTLSNLHGIVHLTYYPDHTGGMRAGVGEAAQAIREAMRQLGLRQRQDALLRFFGSSASYRDFRLIFSRREINGPAVFHYPFAEEIPFPLTNESRTNDIYPVPKDVKSWLAYDDLGVATRLSALLNRPVQIALDSHDDKWTDGPTVAVGLGFTWHTKKLLAAGRLNHKIRVRWTSEPPVTDAFDFDGKEYTADSETDIALVARIVCDGPHVHFICAGRTAPGTAAAGRFLAQRWSEMAELYRGKDLQTTSLAVLIRHPKAVDDACSCSANAFSLLHHVFSGE